jgi:hypothetical protein
VAARWFVRRSGVAFDACPVDQDTPQVIDRGFFIPLARASQGIAGVHTVTSRSGLLSADAWVVPSSWMSSLWISRALPVDHFATALRNAGLKLQDRYTRIAEPSFEGSAAAAASLLSMKDRPTAIFCASV